MAGQTNHGIPTKLNGPHGIPGYPFTTQDEGGERELAAHRDQAEFDALVRWDGRNGYIFFESEDERKSGVPFTKEGRPKPPVMVRMLLQKFDHNAGRLESKSKDLDLIRRERVLIRHFRANGYDKPEADAKRRLDAEAEVWDKAVKMGISATALLDANLRGEKPPLGATRHHDAKAPLDGKPVEAKTKEGK